MMYWNVTYNDPNRWKAVFDAAGPRLSWWQGMSETLRGRPVGSPKLDLLSIHGIPELEELRESINERTAVNFQRTEAGLVAYTKVRLEVYAIPFRWADGVQCTSEGPLELSFIRENQEVCLVMQASDAVVKNFRFWFAQAADEFH
jgi:hypothetical protein